MEMLMTELQEKITQMRSNTQESQGSIDLSDEALHKLYSVYPFNKFEFDYCLLSLAKQFPYKNI